MLGWCTNMFVCNCNLQTSQVLEDAGRACYERDFFFLCLTKEKICVKVGLFISYYLSYQNIKVTLYSVVLGCHGGTRDVSHVCTCSSAAQRQTANVWKEYK